MLNAWAAANYERQIKTDWNIFLDAQVANGSSAIVAMDAERHRRHRHFRAEYLSFTECSMRIVDLVQTTKMCEFMHFKMDRRKKVFTDWRSNEQLELTFSWFRHWFSSDLWCMCACVRQLRMNNFNWFWVFPLFSIFFSSIFVCAPIAMVNVHMQWTLSNETVLDASYHWVIQKKITAYKVPSSEPEPEQIAYIQWLSAACNYATLRSLFIWLWKYLHLGT